MTAPARPRYHVSQRAGWLNDPYGIGWYAGEYRMFWQSNPDAPEWTAGMCWQQASGPVRVTGAADGTVTELERWFSA